MHIFYAVRLFLCVDSHTNCSVGLGVQVIRAAQQESRLALVEGELEGDPDRKVQLSASTSGERTVEEGERSLRVPSATQPSL
jgi:hypothetical protein